MTTPEIRMAGHREWFGDDAAASTRPALERDNRHLDTFPQTLAACVPGQEA
jgi:hypothetical protein